MIVLIGCSGKETKTDSFCYLYTTTFFTTREAATCVVKNNDGVEADINTNQCLYKIKCLGMKIDDLPECKK